jgi:hypothetical protein
MNQVESFELIKRGTVEIIPEAELKDKLQLNRKLIIKAGFDPTAPDLHLGHAVLLRKMKHFQILGHEVQFLLGVQGTDLDAGTARDAREVHRHQHMPAAAGQFNLQVAKEHVGGVDPQVLHRAGLAAASAQHGHAARVRVLAFDAEGRQGAQRQDARLAVEIEVGFVKTIRPGARAHAGQQRVAHGLQRRARQAVDGPCIQRLLAQCIGHFDVAAVGQLEDLGLAGHRPAGDGAAVGVHRVTLAVVFAHEVVDQTGEEDPERVQHQLGHVDVGGDGSDTHERLLCRKRCRLGIQPGNCARPKRPSDAGPRWPA